jgi:APA family basic amino acid/polyamine antiporter
MMLVPIEVLQYSEAPFLDAASPLGWFGGILITFGVLISTAGSVNGNILLSGQMPMALAIDGLAPKIFSKKNRGGSPSVSIIFSCIVSSLLLILNYQEGLINAFVFLISMSTLCTLLPYAISAMAEIKASKKSSNLWISLSLLSLAYICIAMFGSGLKVLLWGLALILAGLPIYYLNGKYR